MGVSKTDLRDAWEVFKDWRVYGGGYRLFPGRNGLYVDAWTHPPAPTVVPLSKVDTFSDFGRRPHGPRLFKPIIVVKKPNGRYQVLDGQHRVHALREAGKKEVLAVVLPVKPGRQASEIRSMSTEADSYIRAFFRRHPKLRGFTGVRVVEKEGGDGRHPEARQHGNEVWIFPKFWKLPVDIRDFVFAHELGHLLLAKFGLAKFVGLAAEHGIDVWEVGALPFAQYNMDEAFADAFASYHLNPGELRRRYPGWDGLVEGVRTAGLLNVPPTELARRLKSEMGPARRAAIRRALEAWGWSDG